MYSRKLQWDVAPIQWISKLAAYSASSCVSHAQAAVFRFHERRRSSATFRVTRCPGGAHVATHGNTWQHMATHGRHAGAPSCLLFLRTVSVFFMQVAVLAPPHGHVPLYRPLLSTILHFFTCTLQTGNSCTSLQLSSAQAPVLSGPVCLVPYAEVHFLCSHLPFSHSGQSLSVICRGSRAELPALPRAARLGLQTCPVLKALIRKALGFSPVAGLRRRSLGLAAGSDGAGNPGSMHGWGGKAWLPYSLHVCCSCVVPDPWGLTPSWFSLVFPLWVGNGGDGSHWLSQDGCGVFCGALLIHSCFGWLSALSFGPLFGCPRLCLIHGSLPSWVSRLFGLDNMLKAHEVYTIACHHRPNSPSWA